MCDDCTCLTPFMSSLFGGLLFESNCGVNIFRLFCYFGLMAIYLCFVYIDVDPLISSIALAAAIFIFQLVMWILKTTVEHSYCLTDSEDEDIIDQPEQFSTAIWDIRGLLKNATSAEIMDIIASGYDPEEVFNLIEFLKENPDCCESGRSHRTKVEINLLYCCNKPIVMPFSKATIDKLFPVEKSFIYILFSTIVILSSTYCLLSMKNLFLDQEIWWVALVYAVSTYSTLSPPGYEPYSTSIDVSWTGATRCLCLTILMGLWKIFYYLDEEFTEIKIPIYDIHINISEVYSTVSLVFKWGVILLPLWIILRLPSHPITTIVWFFEVVNRYLFGQNGVASFGHMISQFLRGAVTVVVNWFILKHDKLGLFGAVTFSTFMAFIPLYSPTRIVPFLKNGLLYTVGATVMSALVSFLVDYFDEITFDNVKWVFFSLFILMDIMCPYVSSNNNYIFFHIRFLSTYPLITILIRFVRFISIPFYITALMKGYTNRIIAAIVICSSVYRAYSEPQHFALFTIFTTLMLPYEFSAENNSSNAIISMLLVTKLMTVLPLVRSLFSHRFHGMESDEEFENLLYSVLLLVYGRIPFIDFCNKFPSLFWSLITGAPCSTLLGQQGFTYNGSPRPFYFWDQPIDRVPNYHDAFVRRVSEYPIETPIYTSAARALAADFSQLVDTGRIGYVQAGDIFLFWHEKILMFVNVITRDPSSMNIQVRGLEYNRQTSCHSGELRSLNDFADDYSRYRHTTGTFNRVATVYDMKGFAVPLDMFTITKVEINQAFVGIESDQIYQWFFAAFIHHACKAPDSFPSSIAVSQSHVDELNGYAPDDRMRELKDAICQSAQVELPDSVYTVWEFIATQLFTNPSTKVLKYSSLYDSFHGNMEITEDFGWVYHDLNFLPYNFFNAIQTGVGCAFLASVLASPDIDSEREDVFDFIENELPDQYVCAPLESDAARVALSEGKMMMTIEKSGNVTELLRFVYSSSDWNVVKIEHEWVKMIWSNESVFYYFYHVMENERASIQSNSMFLNNLIVQSCDPPLGYPAYISCVFESNKNPLSYRVYESVE